MSKLKSLKREAVIGLITQEEKQMLRKLAKRLDRTVSWIVRDALLEYFNRRGV